MGAPVEPSTAIQSHLIVVDPTKNVEGFMLSRKDWATLNRFRTDVGRCRSNLAIISGATCVILAANPDDSINLFNVCPTKYVNGLEDLQQIT